MIKALSIETTEDLSAFSQTLWSLAIPHQISEQSGLQVVWVTRQDDVDTVKEEYARFQQSGLQYRVAEPEISQRPAKVYDSFGLNDLGRHLRASPWISGCIIVSIITTLLLNSPFGHLVFEWLRMGSPAYVVESGEAWRLFTPIFLHANTMHLAFNMLMLWVFGHQIERQESRLLFLVLLSIFSVLPNIAQYFASGSYFGGMSGVVYGVLGYCWLTGKRRPEKGYQFPNALMGFMMVWLLLGFSDILRFAGFGSMANYAHLGGLLTGLLAAFVVTSFRQK
jgi:GlpG protein